MSAAKIIIVWVRVRAQQSAARTGTQFNHSWAGTHNAALTKAREQARQDTDIVGCISVQHINAFLKASTCML